MSDSTNSGITDAQRKTPPWARGMSVARWTAENGVVWDKAAASAIADQWQAELAATGQAQGACRMMVAALLGLVAGLLWCALMMWWWRRPL